MRADALQAVITRTLAANNVRPVDGEMVRGLARSALERFCRGQDLERMNA